MRESEFQFALFDCTSGSQVNGMHLEGWTSSSFIGCHSLSPFAFYAFGSQRLCPFHYNIILYCRLVISWNRCFSERVSYLHHDRIFKNIWRICDKTVLNFLQT
ncbi:hypothetical protein CHS0354_030358 [Potamilus streckersoni]|uniref:Uncharacterized protein n=1 Tax=Potamilus streckersoni TaxID=2493646 RepID=A0AAE0T5A1_9BIVA|nr:hypothetical protein CHS0354_030358 [Potamilus streckersoni]